MDAGSRSVGLVAKMVSGDKGEVAAMEGYVVRTERVRLSHS